MKEPQRINAPPQVRIVLSEWKMSEAGERALAEAGISPKEFREDPEGAALSCLALDGSGETLGQAEVLSDAAGRLFRKDENPRAAVTLYLAAAELVSSRAIAEAARKRSVRDNAPLHQELYAHCCGQVVRLLYKLQSATDQRLEATGEDPGQPRVVYDLRWERTPSREGVWLPEEMDFVFPVEYLEIQAKYGDSDIKREPGIGAPMVGRIDYTEERARINPLLPKVGMSLPITATLEFPDRRPPLDGPQSVTLTLHDRALRNKAELSGRSLPLAADFTTPLATLGNYQENPRANLAMMLRPLKFVDQRGLYQLEPYRKDKIPVILVHGLGSYPGVWLRMVNELRADPYLREKYQLLVYQYPTGFPIPLNAAAFRSELEEFRKTHDPNNQHPTMQQMVLVGHSMGGILINYQIRSSRDTVEKLTLKKPLAEIEEISAEEREYLEYILFFDANQAVRRGVFIGSPHRGSNVAEGIIGMIGARLIRLPSDLLLSVIRMDVLQYMTDLAQYDLTHRMNSITQLRPGSPALNVILKLPLSDRVTLHSVMGKKQPELPLEESSDGVVPYSSAHLDEAVSEKIVPTGHVDLPRDLEVIEEIRRILYLHLEEL